MISIDIEDIKKTQGEQYLRWKIHWMGLMAD